MEDIFSIQPVVPDAAQNVVLMRPTNIRVENECVIWNTDRFQPVPLNKQKDRLSLFVAIMNLHQAGAGAVKAFVERWGPLGHLPDIVSGNQPKQLILSEPCEMYLAFSRYIDAIVKCSNLLLEAKEEEATYITIPLTEMPPLKPPAKPRPTMRMPAPSIIPNEETLKYWLDICPSMAVNIASLPFSAQRNVLSNEVTEELRREKGIYPVMCLERADAKNLQTKKQVSARWKFTLNVGYPPEAYEEWDRERLVCGEICTEATFAGLLPKQRPSIMRAICLLLLAGVLIYPEDFAYCSKCNVLVPVNRRPRRDRPRYCPSHQREMQNEWNRRSYHKRKGAKTAG